MRTFIAAAVMAFAACGMAQAQTDWVRGTVVKADRAHKTITIDHAGFDGRRFSGGLNIQMPAGIDDFKVEKTSLLKGVKPGAAIRFVAVMRSDDLMVTQLQVAP